MDLKTQLWHDVLVSSNGWNRFFLGYGAWIQALNHGVHHIVGIRCGCLCQLCDLLLSNSIENCKGLMYFTFLAFAFVGLDHKHEFVFHWSTFPIPLMSQLCCQLQLVFGEHRHCRFCIQGLSNVLQCQSNRYGQLSSQPNKANYGMVTVQIWSHCCQHFCSQRLWGRT